MYLNITWLPQKPYLFTNGGKMVNSSKFYTFLMADGSWLMMLTTWRQDPGNFQMTVHTLARIPSRAESTEVSADVSQKHEYSKSSWGVWKQSNSIFCTGWTRIYMNWCSLSGPIWKLKWRHIFQQEFCPNKHFEYHPAWAWVRQIVRYFPQHIFVLLYLKILFNFYLCFSNAHEPREL